MKLGVLYITSRAKFVISLIVVCSDEGDGEGRCQTYQSQIVSREMHFNVLRSANLEYVFSVQLAILEG